MILKSISVVTNSIISLVQILFIDQGGPAIILANGGKEWLVNGKRHRLDGPAIEYPNGHKEWYINGRPDYNQYSQYLIDNNIVDLGYPLKKLDLKIGRSNPSGEEYGVEIPWQEGKKYLSKITLQNVLNISNFGEVIYDNVYIGLINSPIYYAGMKFTKDMKFRKSYYVTGRLNNIPFIFARKETHSTMAGQTIFYLGDKRYQYSKYGNL